VPQLIQSGTTEPPALGLTLFRDDQTAVVRQRGYIKQDGVLVADVTADGGAAVAGIRPSRRTWDNGIIFGDLITQIDGKPTPSTKDVAQIISQKKVGDMVHLTVDRDGKPLDAEVTLRPQPLESDQ
jgi:serine protease Do